ncbi:MAG: hypothetical protein J0I20_03735 [Chloroflexi bacterium]|nr:hypothetical protein [Chloroflexota bacterium]OJV89148.1 MAG: hypothetical protein BGO39_34615 [Chloroflexi bacterium 54-19]
MRNTPASKIFQGKLLSLVDIRAIERAHPGQPGLFEIVKGDGWNRFRYGFVVAEPGTPLGEISRVIREYRKSFPGAKLYLSQG